MFREKHIIYIATFGDTYFETCTQSPNHRWYRISSMCSTILDAAKSWPKRFLPERAFSIHMESPAVALIFTTCVAMLTELYTILEPV